MKIIVSLFIILSSLTNGYCQFLMTKKDSTLKVINDTAFVLREFQGEEKAYHAIYIEKNKKAKQYKWLTDFSMTKDEKQIIRESVIEMKSEHKTKPLKKFDMFGLPKNWIPVYYYNKNYYLYGPSDWGNAGGVTLSDSAYYEWYMDGPYPVQILSVTKEKAYTYVIEYLMDRKQNRSIILTIHIIDPKINLAVWEYKWKDGTTSGYRLFVPAASAANFNMVVNYSSYCKQMEFEFQEPDYQKLLKFK